MKMLYILLIALFLVNGAMGQGSIPTFYFDVSAQSNHPAFNLQHQSLNSFYDVQGMVKN